jgi:polar amino acid transport system substrate-binding protein
MKCGKIAIGVCLVVLLTGINVEAGELKVLTEDFVPFNYIENDEITGFTTEIVETLLEKTEVQPERGKILLWPWKRAYKTALEEEDVLLFTTTRTPEREDLFKWVGPIYPREQWMFTLKKRPDIQIKTLEEAKRYTIVEVEDSANYQFFVKHGFEPGKNLLTANTWESKIKMLLAGRVDLASYIPLELAYRLRQVGENYDVVEQLFLVSGEFQYYLAFSLGTPDAIVEQFQRALDAMKQDGTYQKLLEKYME